MASGAYLEETALERVVVDDYELEGMLMQS
jgi:hypothetical protein